MDLNAIIRRVEAAGGTISWDTAHTESAGHIVTIVLDGHLYRSEPMPLIADAANDAWAKAQGATVPTPEPSDDAE